MAVVLLRFGLVTMAVTSALEVASIAIRPELDSQVVTAVD